MTYNIHILDGTGAVATALTTNDKTLAIQFIEIACKMVQDTNNRIGFNDPDYGYYAMAFPTDKDHWEIMALSEDIGIIPRFKVRTKLIQLLNS